MRGGPGVGGWQAFLKPDGMVGVGLHLVTTPGAAPVHLTVVLNPATLGGAWTDSGGNSGTFLFGPTTPVTGAPRPMGGGLASVAVTNVIAGAGLTGGGMGPVNLAVAYRGDRVGGDRRPQRPHACEGDRRHGGGRRCVTSADDGH